MTNVDGNPLSGCKLNALLEGDMMMIMMMMMMVMVIMMTHMYLNTKLFIHVQ